jgi:shikimate kinase
LRRSANQFASNSTMTDIRASRLVCLTGFMGCGKSTTAVLLARQVGWSCIDLDKRITDTIGMEIPEIFSRMGEGEFRRIEHEQLLRAIGESVEQQKPSILSLGGGTTAQPRNLAPLRQNRAILIWLQCAIEELLVRCAQITNRPLFRDETSFRKLYEERLPWYELSDYRVDSSAEPLRTVEQILALGIFPKVNV